MNLEGMTSGMLDLLKNDLDYYLIPPPRELAYPDFLVWDKNKTSINCTLTNNDLSISKTSYTMDRNAYYGAIGNVAVDKFTVRFDEVNAHSAGFFKIGFVNLKFWSIEGKDNVSKGWYIHGHFERDFSSGSMLRIGSPYKEECGPVSFTRIKKNDKITVVVVRENDSIQFIKNGKYCMGIHNYAGINDTNVFPATDIKGGMGVSLTLLFSRINNLEDVK